MIFVLYEQARSINLGHLPVLGFTTALNIKYFFALLFQLLAEFDVLILDLVQLRFQLLSVELDRCPQILFEKIDGVIGFIAFFIQANESSGEVIDDSCFFEVFSELLFFAFGGLSITRST